MADPRHALASEDGIQPRAIPMDATPALQIQLLGGFRVTIGDQVVGEAAWRLRKAAALVKILALTPGQRLHREQILDRLWPEATPDAATNNFHRALHAARRALDTGDRSAGTSLRLHQAFLSLETIGPLAIDVEAFEAAAAAARASQNPALYHAAIELYSGDLLPEDQYEDWVASRRDYLRETYLTLLLEVARLHATRGQPDEAIAALQRVVVMEPAHEEAHVALMRLYARHDQRHQALRQYAQLREALRREIDVEPEAATQELYRELLTGHFVTQKRPTTPPATVRHNLPAQLTNFIGRTRELAEVREALRSTRLLTLVGPGGGGKTSLAVAFASTVVNEWPDGVWLVELAAIEDPALVAGAIAAALGVHAEAQRPIAATLAEYLGPKTILLVMDNCEHVVDACAELAAKLLQASAGLHALATSREALHVPGEVTWVVPPLALPPAQHLTPPVAAGVLASLAQSEAVQLFVDRARWRQPTFTLTAENAPAVVEICRRLDGVPLALELAAARVAVLTVEQIAARLDDALGLLTRGGRTAIPRQQTLRATLEWSYALLDSTERRLFNRLAVFAGGWTITAAEAICGDEALEILDLLAQLIDKSLVQVEAHGGELRYRMLETIRQYAHEQLVASGEADELRQRHAEHFMEVAERVEPDLTGPQQQTILERLERDHDNFRAALRWGRANGEYEITGRLAAALWRLWHVHGHFNEGRAWLKQVLDAPRLPSRVRVKALRGAGALAYYQGDYVCARELFEACVALSRELGDKDALSDALSNLGTVAMWHTDYEQSQAMLEESLALKRALGDKRGVSIAIGNLGDVAYLQGDYPRAAAFYEEGLALDRERGDRHSIAITVNNLGEVMRQTGNYLRAEVYYKESIELFTALGAKHGVARLLSNLGDVARDQADFARAIDHYSESLTLQQELLDQQGIALCLEGLATVAATQMEPLRAARLWGAAERLREASNAPLTEVEHSTYDRDVAFASANVDPAAWAAEWTLGRAMTAQEAATEGLAVANFLKTPR